MNSPAAIPEGMCDECHKGEGHFEGCTRNFIPSAPAVVSDGADPAAMWDRFTAFLQEKYGYSEVKNVIGGAHRMRSDFIFANSLPSAIPAGPSSISEEVRDLAERINELPDGIVADQFRSDPYLRGFEHGHRAARISAAELASAATALSAARIRELEEAMESIAVEALTGRHEEDFERIERIARSTLKKD